MKNKDSKGSTFHSNSEFAGAVEGRKRMWGVSSHVARGTTQTRVKVPKSWLSVEIESGPQPQTAGR